MKCPASFEEQRAPCSTEKAAADFKMPALKSFSRKECVDIVVKPQLSPGLTRDSVSLNNNRGVHNKENNKKEHDRILNEVSLNCEEFEDSGYLSLQNSLLEKGDKSYESEENLVSTCLGQEDLERYTSSTPSAKNPSDSHLPILKFQQSVCQELRKTFSRTKSYDWTIISKLAKDFNLDRVIGGHMGRECVDVFTALLERDMRHILTRILGMLGEVDLIHCKMVSRTWRRIILQDKAALARCQEAEQRFEDSRNARGLENGDCLTRSAALSRVVLSCIQTVASTSAQRTSKRSPLQKDCTPSTRNSHATRFREYQEVASSLKQHESLKHCKLCGSPAKHNARALRATCTRQSCAFDFCTMCHSHFHGSSACRTILSHGPGSSTSRDKAILIGSARSKKNVRRL
ncbi:F-box only protein 5 [Hypomesus transpacificus]|uniref:F-box only protein 5 n=1 Tax=Hypomesus transpacificus TaxID=137520 RepID=UPI001F0827FE|nr:F-box only protein 5 [Hypomesus transpacificus]